MNTARSEDCTATLNEYGYVDDAFTYREGNPHRVVVGPFPTREDAEHAAALTGQPNAPILEWFSGPPGPGNPCPDCGSTCERLPMSEAAATVYDALFPETLGWSEDEDCDMNELMRTVAETAAAALGADTARPGTAK